MPILIIMHCLSLLTGLISIKDVLADHQYSRVKWDSYDNNGYYQRFDSSTNVVYQEYFNGNYTDKYSYNWVGEGYQPNLNYDYMTYDSYLRWKPSREEYTSYNEKKKQTFFKESLDCGDCLRGNFIYCSKSSIFGSSGTSKPSGTCCKDAASCAAKSDSEYACSDEYYDDFLRYQICHHDEKKCGKQVHEGEESLKSTVAIWRQEKGEVCNYKIKAGCNAPAFKAISGGSWTSSLSAWNITYVEYEEA